MPSTGRSLFGLSAALLVFAGGASAQGPTLVLTSAGVEVLSFLNGAVSRATIPVPPGTVEISSFKVSPDGKPIYLAAGTGIYVYNLGSDGIVTQVGTAPLLDPAGPVSLAVTQTQVSAFNTDGSVNIYTRNPLSGVLTPGPEPVELGLGPKTIADIFEFFQNTEVVVDPATNTISPWINGKSSWTK